MTIFQEISDDLESKLPIPFPDRIQLLNEFAMDMEGLYGELIDNGYSPAAARIEVIDRAKLSAADVENLDQLHNTHIYRCYRNLRGSATDAVEFAIPFLPTIIFVIYILKEVTVIDFLIQGGIAVWPILILGGVAILLQFKIIFSWFISKNHSQRSLHKATNTSAILGISTFMISLFGSLLGLYVVFSKVAAIAGTPVFAETAMLGASEALVPLILGSMISLLIGLLYLGIQVGVRRHQLPVNGNSDLCPL